MGRVLKQVSKISGVYGQPAEERVSQFLSENLSDDYLILNSPRIYYHGAIFDIDHIVIGPNGVFVIETKNMQGTILGGIMGNWIQERKGSGKNRRVKIGNPASQVNQYGKAVKAYLGSRFAHQTGQKTNVRVYPTVVFVHDDVDLSKIDFTKQGSIGRVKVLKISELVSFINRREGSTYSEDEITQFAELIVPVDQRDQTAFFPLDSLQDFSERKAGRYEIFEELGRGNFGVVFRGFDYKLDREVAIKKLPLQNQNPNTVNRFYREAQIASGLHHENIVGVYDYYEKSGEYYIVMEMVEGHTLKEYVRENNLTVADSLKIFREICRGLVYAHEKQVVHRDLKPSNILISNDGEIKITDFGIAKLLHSTDLTLEGTGAGTPICMSPEQITGGELTEKSDVFAIGIMLYYLLTRRMPFDGEHLGEIVHQITHLEPIQPSRLNNLITPDMETVIIRALQKNPADRFDSVSEVLQAAEDLLGTGHLSRKHNRKMWLPQRSGNRLFVGLVVSLCVLIASIIGLQIYRLSQQPARELVLTTQYGFTNENLKLLFENPKLYMGMPVNLVGRIDKTVSTKDSTAQFSVSVRPEGLSENKEIIVSYNQPQLALQYASYIKISGSIQNTIVTAGNEQTPVIIADKVETIEDPWLVLAPSQYTVYPNQTVKQKGKAVHLEKIEFAEKETRLYVRIKNEGPANDVIVLANPVGKQGDREFKDLSNDYGIEFPSAYQLQPNQESRKVIFLEPLDRKNNSAIFVLGSSNDILMGQKEYIFNVKW